MNPHIAGVNIATKTTRKVRVPPHSEDSAYDAPMCAFTGAMIKSHRGTVAIIELGRYTRERRYTEMEVEEKTWDGTGQEAELHLGSRQNGGKGAD